MGAQSQLSTAMEFNTAWQLFRKFHDAPSVASAEELVRWLGLSPGHVFALDDALTLWALAGAALVKSSIEQEDILSKLLQ